MASILSSLEKLNQMDITAEHRLAVQIGLSVQQFISSLEAPTPFAEWTFDEMVKNMDPKKGFGS